MSNCLKRISSCHNDYHTTSPMALDLPTQNLQHKKEATSVEIKEEYTEQSHLVNYVTHNVIALIIMIYVCYQYRQEVQYIHTCSIHSCIG